MIYLFYGEDQFSLRQEVARLWETTVPLEARDFNCVKLDATNPGFTIDDVINTAEAFPFLSDKRLIVVNGLLTKLGRGANDDTPKPPPKSGKSKGATAPASPRERFINFVAQIPDTSVLILVEQKAAKNDAIYKAVEKSGQIKEFLPPKDLHLEKWITDHARQQKIKLEPRAATQLKQYIGSDLFRLDNELQKLAAYAGEGQTVTVDMVELLTVAIQDTPIYRLTEALGQRNLREAVLLLNKMRQQSTMPRAGFARYVFSSICKVVYDLVRVREMAAARKSAYEIATELGMHSFVAEKNMKLARNFSADRLDNLYHRLAALDFADKTGKVDLTSELDLLMAEMCAN